MIGEVLSETLIEEIHDATERILERLSKTAHNAEFLATLAKEF